MEQPRPGTVAAEITAPCTTGERHRIWIHRDGTVTLPDHPPTPSELVEEGLGYHHTHPCARVHAAAHRDETTTPPRTTEVNVTGWAITYRSMWTARAMWTANTAFTGVPTYQALPPNDVLAYIHAYRDFGPLPTDIITHLTYLVNPFQRPTGWRRTNAVDASELRHMLDAGMPAERAASALALGLTGSLVTELAAAIGTRVERAAEPLLVVAYAAEPLAVLARLRACPPVGVDALMQRCRHVKDLLNEEPLTDQQVLDLLTGEG